MNQADKDSAKWMEVNAKWQAREIIKSKETGRLYYIDLNGDVLPQKKENNDR